VSKRNTSVRKRAIVIRKRTFFFMDIRCDFRQYVKLKI